MVFEKQSLHGYESNRLHADGVRVENIPRNHKLGHPRRDSFFGKNYSVNLSSSKTGPSSCPCTMTLHCKKTETKKGVNSQTVADYARRFPRGHWSFLGPGSEAKWYGTHTNKPDGSWNRMAEKMMMNFSASGHPIFRASSAFERGYEAREEARSQYTSMVVMKTSSYFSAR